jgi:hypothetical protein
VPLSLRVKAGDQRLLSIPPGCFIQVFLNGWP